MKTNCLSESFSGCECSLIVCQIIIMMCLEKLLGWVSGWPRRHTQRSTQPFRFNNFWQRVLLLHRAPQKSLLPRNVSPELSDTTFIVALFRRAPFCVISFCLSRPTHLISLANLRNNYVAPRWQDSLSQHAYQFLCKMKSLVAPLRWLLFFLNIASLFKCNFNEGIYMKVSWQSFLFHCVCSQILCSDKEKPMCSHGTQHSDLFSN